MIRLLLASSLFSAILLSEGTYLPVKEQELHAENETSTISNDDQVNRDGRAFMKSMGNGNERLYKIVLMLADRDTLQRDAPLLQNRLNSIPVTGWLLPSSSNPEVFNLILDSKLETTQENKPQLLWRSQMNPESAPQGPLLRINPTVVPSEYEIIPAPAAPSNYILTPTAQSHKRPVTLQAPPYSPLIPSQPSFPPPPQSFSPPATSFAQPQKPSQTYGANNPYFQQAFAQQQRPQVTSIPMAANPPATQPPYVASHPISNPPPPPQPSPAPSLIESQPITQPSIDLSSKPMEFSPDQGNFTTNNSGNFNVGAVETQAAPAQNNHPILSQVPPPPPSISQKPSTSPTYIATISYGPDLPSLIFNCTQTHLLTQSELSTGSYVEGPYGYSCNLSQGPPSAPGGQIVAMNSPAGPAALGPAPMPIVVPVGISATELARPEKIRIRPQSQ